MPVQRFPLAGYLPDADPTGPGVITDCTNAIPTIRGTYKGAPTATATSLAALASACLGAAVLQALDGTFRFFAGLDTKLYEGVTSWTDVSRAGDYTTGDKRWKFVQFGNVAIASNPLDILQYSSSGAFADVAGSPKAHSMDGGSGFVMLGGTNEGTYGDQTDRWWCCGYQDYTSWTPAVATQCATGRLVDAPGPITGMKALGAQFVAYKNRAMFLGSYVGSPDVWDWAQIPGEIGCATQEAVVNIGTSHLFVGYEDIYQFDGSRPLAIGAGIKDFFFGDLNRMFPDRIIGMHDKTLGNVWFFYPDNSSSSGTPNAAIVYNYRAQRWGSVTQSVEVAIEYITQQLTYDGMGAKYTTWDDLPAIAYDSPSWLAASPVLAIVDTTHTVCTLSGASVSGSVTMGDVGDDDQFQLLTEVRPRYVTAPTSATMTNQYKDQSGDTLSTDQTVSLVNGKFDVLKSARWHRATITNAGNWEMSGIGYGLKEDGFG